jgi:parallel beta-helix repeat protein
VRELEMDDRPVLSIIIMLLLANALLAAVRVQPASAGTIIVPDDYPTIQEAIDHAVAADTIFVKSGTYYGNITVEKEAISLIGENLAKTIIDGKGKTHGISVSASNFSITGFTIRHTNCAISLEKWNYTVRDCRIFGNNLANNSLGILFSGFGGGPEWARHSIFGNNITNNGVGIRLRYDYDMNIIHGNRIVANSIGIELTTSDNIISGNYIAENTEGIHWTDDEPNGARNNRILENKITSNELGMYVDLGGGMLMEGFMSTDLHGEICHNSFAHNTNQVLLGYYDESECVWDDGYPSGGNYWSDYAGTDFCRGPYQNETGSDGTGDTPYVIDANNKDRYPFLQPNGWFTNFTELSFLLRPNPAYVGQTVTILGNLTDRFGNPISNTRIDVYVNSLLAGTLFTNSSGWFAASAIVNIAASYNVTAVCNVQNCNPSSHTESLIVRPKLNTKVSFVLAPNPVGVGQWVLMVGNLTDINGNPIVNAPLEVHVKSGADPWEYIGSISTDSIGRIWAFGRVMSASTYQVAVVYRGNYIHNLSYHIETLVVSP